jgi:hypothetical protein
MRFPVESEACAVALPHNNPNIRNKYNNFIQLLIPKLSLLCILWSGIQPSGSRKKGRNKNNFLNIPESILTGFSNYF